jgi:endonuclease/exonuclease/phosphatase family metal-dependent hydrolase
MTVAGLKATIHPARCQKSFPFSYRGGCGPRKCGFPLRLVSYNILDGGVGRADPLAEVIQAQHPDIVVLVEADDPAVVDRIAGRLKMETARADGRKHGATILSRWPIAETINHTLLKNEFANCVFEATILDPAGKTWPVTAVHLRARASLEAEAKRMPEINAILEIYSPLRDRNEPHLLAGDFNANSPIQRIDPEHCKPRTREEFIANGNRIPRECIQKLLAAGYVDTLQAASGDAATTIGSFTTQFPGQRIDYIFAFGIDPRLISQAKVEQDRLARYASDHYPVVVQID